MDDQIPQVFETRAEDGTVMVTVEDVTGGASTFPASEARDLASTLSAIADRLDRGTL